MELSNTKNEKQMDITIEVCGIPYTAFFTSEFVLSSTYTHDGAKARIPVILGLNKTQNLEVRNYVVGRIADYKQFLRDL